MNEIIQFSQLLSAILLVVGTITGFITFCTKWGENIINKKIINPIKEPMNKRIDNLIKEFNEKIEEIKEQNKRQNIERCKDYLNEFINDVRYNDVLKSDVQVQRFHEVYDQYKNEYHQNSYIHDGYMEIKRKGLI